MTADEVVEVLDRLEGAGIAVWVDGGWGIDALVGHQTREHLDLDLVVAHVDLLVAKEALAELGFAHDEDARPGLPARLVLVTDDGRRVDLHPVEFDEHGDGWQPLGNDAWGAYPAADLRAIGQIGDRAVGCLSPTLQLRHHLGYPPDENERHDLRLLAEHFNIGLPPGY